MKPFPPPAPIDPNGDWSLCVDVDLHAALAVSRATALTIAALSPEAALMLRRALRAEVEALEDARDPLSVAAADAVRDVLEEISPD